MAEFQLCVTDLIAEALEIGPGFFREMLSDGPIVNRAAWYPPIAQAPTEGHVWAVEHQDFDLITALPRATSAGLEVLAGGEWHRLTPPEGYAVMVTGMVLERLTGGAVPAGFHRVAAVDGQQEARLVALACSTPPEGRVRWTLQLLADQLVELEVVEAIGRECVRTTRKK